ncbi:hypothetical protein BLA6863_01203 [Burkholderia lata]|uniref:Uncharacterized protein n=1 Tax=Burkholderia lata (strain ATCC 17760 / DSM 23089 / LMG 22485 / NCIMB 9086 / R18194 / 383) TaxID=482957 RepID=A0A6P2ID18_BURL3|nr:hypothetical protein BLA6863_01203 [Burkholderia lata]
MKSGDTSMPYIFLQEALDLPHAHAECVHREDLVVEAGGAPLTLGDRQVSSGSPLVARLSAPLADRYNRD